MDKILEVKKIKKSYSTGKGFFSQKKDFISAVDGVSFSIFSGDTLGLVGESGCGKSTLARIILGLIKPDSGKVLFKGKDIVSFSRREMKQARKNMQIVFQDPFNSLDPRFRVLPIILEGLVNFSERKNKKEWEAKAAAVLEEVGLSRDFFNRYPHELSGGQRQRVSIARALVLEPQLLVLDEPVSALDVSIQAQIINLLIDLQKRKNLSYLFIAHDLEIVKYLCNRVCVMRQGEISESGSSQEVFNNPSHPYTKKLLAAVPKIEI